MSPKHMLPELPFTEVDLEPHISARTVHIHHDRHHRGYIDKLNELIVGTQYENSTLLDIVKSADGEIFNNAGQAWNHAFYWQSLSPKASDPRGPLLTALMDQYGGVHGFTEALKKVAGEIFGSGWAWLIVDDKGTLEIEPTLNAGSPVRQSHIPLLCLDVWEHAYYLDYQNERKKHLDAVMNIINWEFANIRFEARLKLTEDLQSDLGPDPKDTLSKMNGR